MRISSVLYLPVVLALEIIGPLTGPIFWLGLPDAQSPMVSRQLSPNPSRRWFRGVAG